MPATPSATHLSRQPPLIAPVSCPSSVTSILPGPVWRAFHMHYCQRHFLPACCAVLKACTIPSDLFHLYWLRVPGSWIVSYQWWIWMPVVPGFSCQIFNNSTLFVSWSCPFSTSGLHACQQQSHHTPIRQSFSNLYILELSNYFPRLPPCFGKINLRSNFTDQLISIAISFVRKTWAWRCTSSRSRNTRLCSPISFFCNITIFRFQ